jgi:hypothetical protein
VLGCDVSASCRLRASRHLSSLYIGLLKTMLLEEMTKAWVQCQSCWKTLISQNMHRELHYRAAPCTSRRTSRESKYGLSMAVSVSIHRLSSVVLSSNQGLRLHISKNDSNILHSHHILTHHLAYPKSILIAHPSTCILRTVAPAWGIVSSGPFGPSRLWQSSSSHCASTANIESFAKLDGLISSYSSA